MEMTDPVKNATVDGPRPMSKALEISLVIPAYNEEAYVGQTLDSVIEHGHGKFKQIIVVDNNSSDKTSEVAAARTGVTVLKELRKGTSNARQTGVEQTTSDLIAFMDADTMLPEGWIEKALKTFEDPKVVMLSGPARYFDAVWYQQWVLNALWWLSGALVYPLVGYMVLGGNCVVRASALKEIGGLDRSITFYGDDTNMAQRLAEVGKVLFKLDFFIYYSARRWKKEGFWYTAYKYATNYVFHVLFKKPLSKEHVDVR